MSDFQANQDLGREPKRTEPLDLVGDEGFQADLATIRQANATRNEDADPYAYKRPPALNNVFDTRGQGGGGGGGSSATTLPGYDPDTLMRTGQVLKQGQLLAEELFSQPNGMDIAMGIAMQEGDPIENLMAVLEANHLLGDEATISHITELWRTEGKDAATEAMKNLPEEKRETIAKAVLKELTGFSGERGNPLGSLVPDAVGDAVGDAAGFVAGGVGDALEATGISPAMGQTLEGFAALGRGATQLYRTGVELADSSPDELTWDAIVDEVGDSWTAAGAGEEYVSPDRRDYLLNAVGGDQRRYDLLNKVAAGKEYAVAAEEAGYSQAEMADPTLAEELFGTSSGGRTERLIDEFRRSRRSFGRDLVRTGMLASDMVGLGEHDIYGTDMSSGWSKYISGMGDGVWAITMDPLILAGAGRRALTTGYRAALGVRSADDSFRLAAAVVDDDAVQGLSAIQQAHGRSVRAAVDQLAQAVGTGKLDPIAHQPSLFAAFGELVEVNTRRLSDGLPGLGSTDELLDYLRNDGQALVARTALGGRNTARRTVAPTWGAKEQAWYKAKQWTHETVDLLKVPEAQRRMILAGDELTRGQRAQAHLLAPVTKVLNAPAEAFTFLTTHTPHSSVLLIDLPPEAMASQWDRMVEEGTRFFSLGRAFGMDEEEVLRYTNMFIVGDTVGPAGSRLINGAARRQTVTSFLEDVFDHIGVPEGHKVVQKFLSREGQRYTLDSAVGAKAFLPHSQTSMQMMVPNAKELFRAATSYSHTRKVANVAMPELLETGLNRIWKPGVLLRAGFITRASGEEFLAFLARFGPKSYLGTQMAVGHVQHRIFDETVFGRKVANASREDALDAVARVTGMRPDDLADFSGMLKGPDRLAAYSGRQFITMGTSRLWAPLHGFTNLLHHASLVFTKELDDLAVAKIAAGDLPAPLSTKIAGLTKALDDQVLTAALRGRQMKGVGAALNPLRTPSWLNKGYVKLQASLENDLVASRFLHYVNRKAGMVAEDGRITQASIAKALGGYTDDDFRALGEVLTDPFLRRAMAEEIGVASFANQALEGADVGLYRMQQVGIGRDGRPLYRKVYLREDVRDQGVFPNPQLAVRSQDIAEFRRVMADRANEVVRDNFVGPNLHHLLDHVDEGLEASLAKITPEGVDPLVHAQGLRDALTTVDRKLAQRYENARLGYGGQTPEDLLRGAKALIDPAEVGGRTKREALDRLLEAHAAGDQRLVQSLLGQGQLTRDLDEVLARIRSDLHQVARRPAHQRVLSGSESYAASMVRPQDEAFIPIYGLVVNPSTSPDLYARLAADPSLQRGIIDDLAARHPDTDPKVFGDLVARILDDGPSLTPMHSGLVAQGVDRAPLSRWVTSDDRIARSVEDVLSERFGTYVGMGRHQVHQDEWFDQLEGSLKHLGGDANGVAHYATNDAHLLQLEVLPTETSTVLLTVDDLDTLILGRPGTAGAARWQPPMTGAPDELAERLPPPAAGKVRVYQGSDEALNRWYFEPPTGPEVRYVDVSASKVRQFDLRDWDTGVTYGSFTRLTDEEAAEAVTFARQLDATWEPVPIDVTDQAQGWDAGPDAAWDLDDHRAALTRLANGEVEPDEVTEAATFLRSAFGTADQATAAKVLLWDRMAGPSRPIRELSQSEYDELVEALGTDVPVASRRVVPGPAPTDPEAFSGPIDQALREIELRFTSRHAPGDSERVLNEAVGPTLHRESKDLSDDIWGGIELDDLPVEVYGPRMADVNESRWDQLVRVGFDAVSASIASIIRKPLFLQEYAQARHTVAPFFAKAEAKLAERRREVDSFMDERFTLDVFDRELGEVVTTNFWDADALDEFIQGMRTGRLEVPWPHPVNNLENGSAEAFHALRNSVDPDELADISLQMRFSMLPSPDATLADANRTLQILFDVPDPALAEAMRNANRRFMNLVYGNDPKHRVNVFNKAIREGRLDQWVRAIDDGALDVSDIIPHDSLRATAQWARNGRQGKRPLGRVTDDQLQRLRERLDEWQESTLGAGYIDDSVEQAKQSFLADRRAGKVDPHPSDLSEEEMLRFHRYVRSRIAHEDTLRDVTTQRALHGVIPYIDDHRIRSQFQEYVGNLIPFWFAEEQFLKRWSRIIAQSPEVIRYGQLSMQAARSSGVIRDDGFGGEVFVVPGSGAFMQVLTGLADKLVPGDIVEPLANPLTMSTAYMLPGFGDQTGTPSFGPMVGVGLEFLTSVNPELGYRLARQLRTDETGSRDYLDFLLPAHVQRLRDNVEVWMGGENEALAAATVSAISRLALAGHALEGDASPEEMQAFLDRVSNQARIEMVARMGIGWAGPTTPTIGIEPEWTDELQQMLDAGVPYEDAITIYLAKHPDATLTTISKTVSTTGAPMAADEAALAEMFTYLDSPLAERYPEAAAWLILPQRSPDDEFASHVFHAQLRAGFRERRSPEEFIRASVFQQVADTYFTTVEEMEAEAEALAATDQDAAARHVRTRLSAWRDTFLARHPIFAQELSSSEGRQRRESILRQASLMVRDEEFQTAYPEQAQGLVDLVSLVEDYRGARWGLKQSRSKAAMATRAAIDDDFAERMTDLLDRQPDLRTFYDRVIRPSLQLDDLEEMAA